MLSEDVDSGRTAELLSRDSHLALKTHCSDPCIPDDLNGRL